MTPATFRTLVEANGLPIPWIAKQAGVTERTPRYWGTGRMSVPDEIAQLVTTLDTVSIVTAQKALDGPFDPVVLVRYRTDEDLWKYRPDMKGLPVGFHGGIIARIMLLAKVKLGIEVIAEWLDVDAYSAWLKATKQKDSESLRSQFVAMSD